jgi:serine/threonine protein kinase
MRECPRCENCYPDDVLVCPEEGGNTRQTLPGSVTLASRYQIKKRLGRGAMGQVYLAVDLNLQTRKVAVKTVRPELLNSEDLQEGEAIARFEREARTAASIRHPNVVDVTDFGKTPEGVFYLVMEYVQGETLHDLLRREGTLNVQRSLTILEQVSSGVEAAHEHGILHRDLKPANIFLMKTRKSASNPTSDGFVKVGDFGLAKIIDDAMSDAVSGTGPASRGIIGTPDYMAPEQMDPGVKLDARADVYALGTIAYHLLGGRPPFTGDLTQLIMQKMMQSAPPLRSLRTDISAELERAVMHALERDPTARPSSPMEWIDEVHAATAHAKPASEGESRVVVMAPQGAEVYVDDERHGSIGRSGRIILNSIAPGRHVLRVARSGEAEDEREIEIRPDASEQIIQAQLRPHQPVGQSQSTPSGLAPPSSQFAYSCSACGTSYPLGVKFCGRCGGKSFRPFSPQPATGSGSAHGQSQAAMLSCSRCGLVNPPGTRFCGKCGAPVTPLSGFGAANPVQRVCPRCQTSSPPAARFCGKCGLPFS